MKVFEGVKVYNGDIVYFNDWLVINGHKSLGEIKEDMRFNNESEETIETEIETLYDEFCEWADENELMPMYS